MVVHPSAKAEESSHWVLSRWHWNQSLPYSWDVPQAPQNNRKLNSYGRPCLACDFKHGHFGIGCSTKVLLTYSKEALLRGSPFLSSEEDFSLSTTL